jgi:hypothetical protein
MKDDTVEIPCNLTAVRGRESVMNLGVKTGLTRQAPRDSVWNTVCLGSRTQQRFTPIISGPEGCVSAPPFGAARAPWIQGCIKKVLRPIHHGLASMIEHLI